MKQHQAQAFRLIVLILAAFVVSGVSCGPAAKALENLKGASDEAGKIAIQAADPSELRAASTKLDGLMKEVPSGTSMTAEEQSMYDLAGQRAAAYKEIADRLQVPGLAALISKDSVLLVSGATVQDPGPKFRALLEEAVGNILRDTTCSIAADEANRQLVKPNPLLPASASDPYTELTKVVTATDNAVSTVQKYVNLSGLSSTIVTKASSYVGMAKKTVSAAAWNNGGAFRTYLRLCVLK